MKGLTERWGLSREGAAVGVAGIIAFLLILTSRLDELTRLKEDFQARLFRGRQERFAAKEVTLELVPQGILCERMRAAAAGILGFYTTVGVGTEVAAGKEERLVDNRRCILESPIHADYAFIKAQKADELGNLTYRLAARNFNPIMAMAAKTTIVEVEEIVPVGAIEPENVVTPAIFVHRIVQAKGIRYAG